MTDDPEKKDAPEDPIVKLRDEMAAQFSELKESFASALKEKEDEIARLKEQNTGLQRALVRSAQMDPPAPAPEPKSEEQIYQETIDRLSKRTIELMKAGR